MARIIPVVMIRNEERFIARVLRPLAQVFGFVLVADTGSTDDTRREVLSVPNVHLIDYGPQAPRGLTEVRRDLGRLARMEGADWQFLCDGDELYTVAALTAIRDTALPPHVGTAFTTMTTLDEDEQGEMWEMDDIFSRQALLPANDVWGGVYPFDVPASFGRSAGFYYYPLLPQQRYHAVHLHRLVRSKHDDAVALRLYKQKRFSLLDTQRPRTIRFAWEDWCAQ